MTILLVWMQCRHESPPLIMRSLMVTLAGLEPATSPAPVNKDALSPLSYSVVTIFTTVCGGAGAEDRAMALGVGATEKAPCEKLPPPIPLSHQRMWLRCATGGSGNSPSHWWCRSCDGDHSALGGLLLWSHRTAGGDGAYHVSILHELGAAELAALFLWSGLPSLAWRSRRPKKLQNVMA